MTAAVVLTAGVEFCQSRAMGQRDGQVGVWWLTSTGQYVAGAAGLAAIALGVWVSSWAGRWAILIIGVAVGLPALAVVSRMSANWSTSSR